MKILIDLDPGFLARIERERLLTVRIVGKRPTRTGTMRTLLREALDARCATRGEDVPTAVVAAEPTNPSDVPFTGPHKTEDSSEENLSGPSV